MVKSQKLVSTTLLPPGSQPACLWTSCEGDASTAEGSHSSTLMHGECLKLLSFPHIFNSGALAHSNFKRCSWSLLFLFVALILLTWVSESACRGTPCAGEVLSRFQRFIKGRTKWICWRTRCDVERKKKINDEAPRFLSYEVENWNHYKLPWERSWEKPIRGLPGRRVNAAEIVHIPIVWSGLQVCFSWLPVAAQCPRAHLLHALPCMGWAWRPTSLLCTRWSRGLLQASLSLPNNHIHVWKTLGPDFLSHQVTNKSL